MARPAVDAVEPVLPGELLPADPAMALLSGLGLGALAWGLMRRKSITWWLAVATLVFALLAQGWDVEHPVGEVVIGGLVGILLVDRRRYRVETGSTWRRRIVALIVVAGLVFAAEVAFTVASTGTWPRPLALLSVITAGMGNSLGVSDALASSILHLSSRGGLLALLLVAARLPVVLAAIGVLAVESEPPADPRVRARASDIADRFGRGALLPFQLGTDKRIFVHADAQGLLVYGLAGRHAVMLGDVIGPAAAARPTLAAFLEQCRRRDCALSVYQASASGRVPLLEAGFQLFRIGLEAVIDLPTFDLSGSRRANVRHTVTRARRDGVTVEWFPRGLAAADRPGLAEELAAIDAVWRQHAGPELGFTISRFEPDELARLAATVAFGRDGHPLAFATFRPTGTDGGMVLDLMRRSPTSPPGVVETCIACAALALKSDGAPLLSLGLAPLAGLDPRSGPLTERVLAAAGRLVRPWYDVSGLAFFKGKFDPRWEPRYAAVPTRHDVLALGVSLLRLHLRRAPLHARTAGPVP